MPEDPRSPPQEAEYMNTSNDTMFASVDVQDLVAYIKKHRQRKDGFSIQFQVGNFVESICGLPTQNIAILYYNRQIHCLL